MAFNAQFDVQAVLNRIFVPPSSEPDISDGTPTSDRIYTFEDMKQIRAQILSGLERHYRDVFSEILEQSSGMMKMQSDLNNILEARNAEFRSKFLSTYEVCQIIKFERDGLRRQLVNEAEKYQALLESHRDLSEQLLNSNRASFDSENILDDVNDMITRICMIVDISRSVSSVDGTPVARMVYPSYQPQDGDVFLASPPTPVPQGGPARAISPLDTSAGSPSNIDAGVLVEADEGSPVNVDAGAAGEDRDGERPLGDFDTEIFNLKQQIIALDWERQSFSEQLELARAENQLRAEHIDQLEAQLKQCKENEDASFHERARGYLELGHLRKEHGDMQRRLKIAEANCERLHEEKANAIGTNKHLEAANKELKQRIKNIKESVVPLVKAELKKDWEAFMAKVKKESERISTEFFLYAEKANTDQVKYYESTSDLGKKYTFALEEIRALREELATNFRDDKYPHEPLALNQSLAVLNKQLKTTLRENETLREEVKSRQILLEATDKTMMVARLVELESRILRLVKKEHALMDTIKERGDETRRLHKVNEDQAARIIKMQRDFLFRLQLGGKDLTGLDDPSTLMERAPQ